MQQLILFEPPSDWQVPKALPRIPSGVVLGLDTETRDDGLNADRGPGWVFNLGHICGVSMAWEEYGSVNKIYAPVCHPETQNMDAGEVFAWTQDALDRAAKIVMHNGGYDAGWLSTVGVRMPWEKVEDTSIMAVMVDENRDEYNLDACCQWRGVPGKDEALLREAAAAYGITPTTNKNIKRNLWKLPAKYVGPYGEQDPVSTLALWKDLRGEIESQGLEKAYQLELDLLPMFFEMRKRGIRIDEDAMERAREYLRGERDEVLGSLRSRMGWRKLGVEDILSPISLEKMFDQENLPYPRTPKTRKGSFKKEWLEAHEHWLPKAVVQARKLENLAEKFIGGYIIGSLHVGRIHAEVHQLRDDDGGTRSYRLAYSNPPLQQMPARDKLAPIIRAGFLPEPDELWLSCDYSAQEPRITVHFAAECKLSGSEIAVRRYNEDPDTDYHQMVADITGLPRKDAKVINLGLAYGMGIDKLARSLGVSVEEATEILDKYNSAMPFVMALNEFCQRRADKMGFIRLIDGARCRFDDWELAWKEDKLRDSWMLPHEEALERAQGRRIKRAGIRKAMNRLIQGSAARQTKMAMRECWRAGILPLIQMHDELGVSVSSEKEALLVSEIMQDVVKLRVPMKVDRQYGKNWGQASEEPPKGISAPTWAEIQAASVTDRMADILARRGGGV